MTNPVMTAQIVSEAEIDRSIWKILILGVFLIGASVLSAYTFNQLLLESELNFFLYTILSSVFFLALVILNALFIKSYSRVVLFTVLAAAAPLALFYPEIDVPLAIGALFFFLFLTGASRRGYIFLENSLKIRFFLTASSILPKAVTGLLIFFAVVFFTHYFNIETRDFNERINRSFVNQLVVASEPAVRFFLPGFSAQQTTDEALRLFVFKQIGSLVPDYDRYLPDVRKRIFDETFSNFKKNLETAVGPINGEKPLTESLYSFLTGRYLDNLSADNKLLFAVGFTLAIFLIAKGIVSVFHWLIEFLTFLIFKILLITNFAYISLENRSREFVALS